MSQIISVKDKIRGLYAYLRKWHEEWSHSSFERAIKDDPLLALYGSGRDLWADEHADEYVARLGSGWQ